MKSREEGGLPVWKPSDWGGMFLYHARVHSINKKIDSDKVKTFSSTKITTV